MTLEEFEAALTKRSITLLFVQKRGGQWGYDWNAEDGASGYGRVSTLDELPDAIEREFQEDAA